MAGELVSFGIQKLWDLLSQECKRFKGVEDQVTELKCDLDLLSSFLKDANARKHTSAVVKNFVEVINEIICDAEDIIETFLLKQKLEKPSGIRKSIKRHACIILDRRELASDIGGISKKISKVIRDMQNFGVQQIITDGAYIQPLHDQLKEMRLTFPMDYESDFVGLEANVKKLVGYLVEEDNVQVVSITGMGGLGKTTLARQVFNHEDVKHHFDGLAWVCVSQDFSRKNVWQKILGDLKPKEEEKITMTESTLQGELFRLLETSKSLIVLDDIWKDEDWDLIQPIFPPRKGWKVLLTSRNESVAMHRNSTYINLKPDCLTTEDSWKLFQKIALPRNDASEFEVDDEMLEMGKQMIKHCGGLPLAIKVLGGLLAAKYTIHDWKRVSENIGSHLVGGRTYYNDDNNSSVYHVLSMSFEELPNYLKHCFLYLAHFPEDYAVNVENLSYYWAAEGISKPRHNNEETIRDVGDIYIEELVRRNMVISERDVKTLRFETCHLHDMMREICLFKAKEENFLQITGSRPPTTNFQSPVTSCRLVSHYPGNADTSSSTAYSQSPSTSRRLVCQYPTTLDIERGINNPKLRSLVVVWHDIWWISSLRFTRVQMLRVLDLSRIKYIWMLPSSIGKLIHLRYLSLQGAEVFGLPSSLGNLKLLIYLNLNMEGLSILVPNVLMGMQELRYLALPRSMREKKKLELSNLVNLETLINFSTKNSSLEDLCGMVRLRTLIITLTSETTIQTLSSSIGGLGHLENLSIQEDESNRMIEEGIVLDFFHLKYLWLNIYMPRLPKAQHFPSRLTILVLSFCCLEEDPIPILEKLLHLKEVGLWYESFCGRRIVCSGSGFPQLRRLELFGLEEWEEWIIEEGSMPRLYTLSIRYCPKLKELPDGLRFLYSLKDLSMAEEWKERLSEGGQDYYKVKHIPSVKFSRKEQL